MADRAYIQTDKELARLEKRIHQVYGDAREDIQDKITEYFDRFVERDKHQKALLEAGKIDEAQYKQWRLNQFARGERYIALRDQLAERMTKANETAVAYTNDITPGIYSLNRNYAAYTIEQASGDVGFTLWDEQTVKRLIVEQPELMPYYPPGRAVKRGIDLEYGRKKITACITTGVLQGESIGKIANRLQDSIVDMNRTSALRTARTAVTGAQNAGRLDTYYAAQKMGITLQKEWLATLDGRTRDSHRWMDRKKADIDKKFPNGCRYPGDPQGPASEVYNCRCTLVSDIEGVREDPEEAAATKRRARDPETGKSVLVSDMTYSEWEKSKKARKKAKSAEPIHKAAPTNLLVNVTDEYEKTATPGQGAVEYDAGYKIGKHQEEIKIANWLHDKYGGDIKLLNESDEFGVKMPDYNWRGKLWELKTTSTANATDNAVRKSIKQIQKNPGGIILDYGDRDIDVDALLSVISKRVVRSNLEGIDVMILSKGTAVKILRYKK